MTGLRTFPDKPLLLSDADKLPTAASVYIALPSRDTASTCVWEMTLMGMEQLCAGFQALSRFEHSQKTLKSVEM